MPLRFAFLLFSLYTIYNFTSVKFNEEKKKIKWKTKERERKSTRDRRKKEEETKKKTFKRKKRDDDDDEMYVYIYIYIESAWHRVRDTPRVFAALTFARWKMRRDYREECFLHLRE